MTHWQLPPDALTMVEAAKYLGTSHNTLMQQHTAYEVPSVMIGGWRYFFKSDLDEWRRKNPKRLVGRAA